MIPELTWAVPAGQIVGLLGPSGCGKTTLMRTVVGVQIVERGDVQVLGRPAGHRVLRQRVGYVTQNPSVYGDLTVTENLRYFAAVVGVRRSALTAEVDRVLQLVDLTAHATARVDQLSGGQQSRVSLGAAWWELRSCWFLTSRRSASIRFCAAISGRSSGGWPTPAPPSSSPVM